mmetsp:Transcript_20701/g.31139  ORF Transcript_20701/g.31139 Transcript_20701/m.31139 type:complete len:310 (+) Transcript_20701:116-1045(+)
MIASTFLFLASFTATTAFVPQTTISSSLVRLQVATTSSPPSTSSISNLMKQNKDKMDILAKVDPDASEMTQLRFALGFGSMEEAKGALRESAAWRAGPGKAIVTAAKEACERAMEEDGKWNNDAVRDAAPHASVINQFITPRNILTVPTESGDLLYVIRASVIDDKGLMNTISVEQMVDFFAYVKEVHSIVADKRSLATGRLCSVALVNDIKGTRQAPDAKFSKALTSSSKQYENLYPTLAGPTLITNLPLILQAFASLLKPFFPKTVQERLKFIRAPALAALDDLTPLSANAGTRKVFVDEIRKLTSE